MEDLRTECSGCGNMVTSVEIQEDIDIGQPSLSRSGFSDGLDVSRSVDAEASGKAVRVLGSRRLYFFNDPRGA